MRFNTDMFGDYARIMMENEYFAERRNSTNGEFPTFPMWKLQKNSDIGTRYRLDQAYSSQQYGDMFNIYKTETGKVVDQNDKVNFLLYLDWLLNKYVNGCETIVKTTKTIKNCDNEIIIRIGDGEIELEELINGFVDGFCNGCEYCKGRKYLYCKKNDANLKYILYKMFKERFAYKSVEVTTTIMDETIVENRMMWINKNDNVVLTNTDTLLQLIDRELFSNYENVEKLCSTMRRFNNSIEYILQDVCRE